MKLRIETILTPRVALMTTLGCLLAFGIFFFTLKGCNSVGDMSLLNHPYLSEAELKSTEPIEVEPFIEPSLKGLVAQLKAELGLTEAEIAETAEMLAQDRFMDNLNFMDSRRDANSRQVEWERRKRLVVAKPKLLWTFGFILPPTLDVMELKDKALYDYSRKHALKLSKSQEKRRSKLHRQWQNDKITELEYLRGKAAIVSESYPLLTVAKSYSNPGVGQPGGIVGREYAELAIAENPDSFEAHHVWALCNRAYYGGTDHERVIAGYRQLVERFPNSSIANFGLARELTPFLRSPVTAHKTAQAEEALVYLKRAIQLDDRIEPNNELLASCYFYLGDYEKALAVYQGMSEVYYGHAGGLVTIIYDLQDKVSKLRQQQDSE